MVYFKLASVFLFVLFFNKSVICEQCDANGFAKCPRNDNECVKNQLEPSIRSWMLKGQPGYFLEPLDPITFPELPVVTSKGVYTLKNVKITGFPDAKFSDNIFDLEHGSLQFTYEFKFDLTADGFIDANGQSLLDQGPLIVHLDNLLVKSKTEVVAVERCGEKFVKFDNSQVTVTEGAVAFKSGLKNPDEELKHSLAQIVGKACIKKIAGNYRAIARVIPVQEFWK